MLVAAVAELPLPSVQAEPPVLGPVSRPVLPVNGHDRCRTRRRTDWNVTSQLGSEEDNGRGMSDSMVDDIQLGTMEFANVRAWRCSDDNRRSFLKFRKPRRGASCRI